MENDELGLKSKYGLKYVPLVGPIISTVFPDDRALVMYTSIDKTCESIAQFSKRDAEVYPKYYTSLERITAVASMAAFSVSLSFGFLPSFLDSSKVIAK